MSRRSSNAYNWARKRLSLLLIVVFTVVFIIVFSLLYYLEIVDSYVDGALGINGVVFSGQGQLRSKYVGAKGSFTWRSYDVFSELEAPEQCNFSITDLRLLPPKCWISKITEVEELIEKLINPPNCEIAVVLYLPEWMHGGFGSSLNAKSAMIATAIIAGITPISVEQADEPWAMADCKLNSIHCYFEQFSHCGFDIERYNRAVEVSTFEEMETMIKNGQKEMKYNIGPKVDKVVLRKFLSSRQLPLVIFHSRLLRRLMRLHKNIHEEVIQGVPNLEFSKTMALHIRRSEMKFDGRKIPSFDIFVNAVRKMKEQNPEIKYLYVASDVALSSQEVQILKSCSTESLEVAYTIMPLASPGKVAKNFMSNHPELRHNMTIGTLRDVYGLLNAKYFVGTQSNWVTLVNGLRLINPNAAECTKFSFVFMSDKDTVIDFQESDLSNALSYFDERIQPYIESMTLA